MELRYRFRLYFLTAAVLTGFAALLSRLHDFQIVRRDDFRKLIPGDRIVSVREPGVRGEITDRNGITLAKNIREYEINFNLEEIKIAYQREHSTLPMIDRVTVIGGMKRKKTEIDIVKIVMDSVIKRLQDLGLARNFNAEALRTHYFTHFGFVPLQYRGDLTYEEFSKFAEHNLDLPGVYLSINSRRQYPYGALASHVIGYTRQWQKDQIPDDAKRKFDHYVGDETGIAGVEASMDSILVGPGGRREMLKDEKGSTRDMPSISPGMGATVTLTLDARAQYLAEQTLRHAGRAAAVVMDVETGEILAMASVPDFDPNQFTPAIDAKQYAAYKANKAEPLMNRAISNYTPGSTFKLGTAISAALEGQATRRYSCNGFVTYGNAKVGCWIWNQRKGSHGSETLQEAIRNSCNPYFNMSANTIGSKAMTDGFTMLGFGKPTGVPLPREAAGLVIGNRTWRSMRPGKNPTPHDLALFSIGQSVLATPLQLCSMVSTIANGGKAYQPRLVKSAIATDGTVLIEDKPKLEVDLIQEGVKASDLAAIREGMWMAVNKGGTANAVKLPDIQIAAKTGTAQVNLILKTLDCWTVGFAPYEKPKYAVAVLVQDGGSGGHTAGPLVQNIVRGLVYRDRGNALPLQAQKEYGGHMNRIETIAALEALPPPDPGEESGEETGDEVTILDATPLVVPPDRTAPIPTPTIAPEVDEEGTIPKAILVPEDD